METLFTKKEAAAYLKGSKRTVDREIKRFGLTVHKVGRQVRIPVSTLEQILKRRPPNTIDSPINQRED